MQEQGQGSLGTQQQGGEGPGEQGRGQGSLGGRLGGEGFRDGSGQQQRPHGGRGEREQGWEGSGQQQPGGGSPGVLQLEQQPHRHPAASPRPPPDSYQLESLTHLFVRCPVAVEAWAWFAQVWDRVQPGVEVDFSSVRLLLLDDCSVWQPPAALHKLWTYLRLLMLESIWAVRCSSEGRPFSSSQITRRFMAQLQQQLKQDWARMRADIRVDSGVPMSWLRGRSPMLPEARFAARWQPQGVLYEVEGGGPRLCFGGGAY